MITNIDKEKAQKRQYELERVLAFYGFPIESEKYKIVCPFHADKNASMLIDLSSGTFHCFGCGARGEAIDFIKLIEKGLSDFDCCRKLASILNGAAAKKNLVHVEYKTPEQQKKEIKRNLLAAKDYYYNLSQPNWFRFEHEIKDYMIDRGFIPSTLNKYGCRLNTNKDYPVIFPILDNGCFAGYVCRTTDIEVQQKRKYLYNTGFRRCMCLAGDYHSKTIMIVEGYMDYLKAKQFGVKNVVALLGWKASIEQINKLKKNGVIQIVSALDNDKCGKDGTKYLRKYFNVTRFVYPKDVKDIGEMSKKTFEQQRKKTQQIINKKRNENKWV